MISKKVRMDGVIFISAFTFYFKNTNRCNNIFTKYFRDNKFNSIFGQVTKSL